MADGQRLRIVMMRVAEVIEAEARRRARDLVGTDTIAVCLRGCEEDQRISKPPNARVYVSLSSEAR